MQNLSPRRTRRLGATLVASGLLALATGFFAPVSAAGVAPTLYDGEPSKFKCAELAPQGETWLEYKVEPWSLDPDSVNGAHIDKENDFEVVISNATEKSFDWDTNRDVAAVLVKGGPVGNVYSYPGDADTHDEGLMAPINPNGGDDVPRTYGISHVSFCWPAADDDTPGGDEPKCVDGVLPSGEPCEESPGGDEPKCVDGVLPSGEPCEESPGGDEPKCVDGVLPSGEPCEETPGAGDPTCVDHPQEICAAQDQPGDGGDDPADPPAPGRDVEIEVLGEGLERPGPELPRTGTGSNVLAGAGALLVALGMTSMVASKVPARQVG